MTETPAKYRRTRKPATPATAESPLTIRGVRPELLERADALVEVLAADAELATTLGGHVSRADVLRLALLEGIRTLERRHKR